MEVKYFLLRSKKEQGDDIMVSSVWMITFSWTFDIITSWMITLIISSGWMKCNIFSLGNRALSWFLLGRTHFKHSKFFQTMMYRFEQSQMSCPCRLLFQLSWNVLTWLSCKHWCQELRNLRKKIPFLKIWRSGSFQLHLKRWVRKNETIDEG
jgi:hypothetical protein